MGNALIIYLRRCFYKKYLSLYTRYSNRASHLNRLIEYGHRDFFIFQTYWKFFLFSFFPSIIRMSHCCSQAVILYLLVFVVVVLWEHNELASILDILDQSRPLINLSKTSMITLFWNVPPAPAAHVEKAQVLTRTWCVWNHPTPAPLPLQTQNILV